jgi:hypothetical protein
MFFLNNQERLHLSLKPFSFKLLIALITIKPLINSFWNNYIPLLNITFLQLSSILALIIMFFGLFKRSLEPIPSLASLIFGLFCISYFLNLFAVLIFNFDFNVIKLLAKVSIFPLSFYYCKNIINNELDFYIILNAFIKSIIPAMIIGIYDVYIVNSYSITRNLVRYDSSFGDIANIGLHINMVLLIMNYYFLNDKKNVILGIDKSHLVFFIFSLIMLTKISHGTSFAIFFAINGLFLLFKFSKNFFFTLLSSVIPLILVFIIFNDWISTFYQSFLSKEINSILSGEFFTISDKNDIKYLFHGRLGRWLIYLEEFSNLPNIIQYFGGYAVTKPWIFEHALHNDFLRLIFSLGYVGFFLYILFIVYILIFSFKVKDISGKYLILASIFLLLLYSITLTPTTYMDLSFMISTISIYTLKKYKS